MCNMFSRNSPLSAKCDLKIETYLTGNQVIILDTDGKWAKFKAGLKLITNKNFEVLIC